MGRSTPLACLAALGWLACATTPALAGTFGDRLAQAALERTHHEVRYDPRYVPLAYPGGDVPDDRGVCTDVVIRAYRALGIDLQKEVHEEMAAAFDAFPHAWGLKKPDANIDHRRVLNLETFFKRRGRALPLSHDPRDYAPGDVITWRLPYGGRPHIGIVTGVPGPSGNPLVVHNVGWGTHADDVLFDYTMAGHFRYAGPPASPSP
jgi:uncharacterized protein YijF (DUF1287 family)